MPDGFSAIPETLPAPTSSAEKQTQCDEFPVVCIKEGGKDSQDRIITRVYAMRPGKYAVYLAGDVRICWWRRKSAHNRRHWLVLRSCGLHVQSGRPSTLRVPSCSRPSRTSRYAVA